MYKIKDLTHANRTLPFADGTIISFHNHEAVVADKYVDYFKRISDFQVGAYIPDTVKDTQSIAKVQEVKKEPFEKVEDHEGHEQSDFIEATPKTKPEIKALGKKGTPKTEIKSLK